MGSQALAIEPYAYCWQSGGMFGGTGACADGAPDDGKPEVSVAQGTVAELAFDGGQPPGSVVVSASRGAPYGSRQVALPATSDDLAFVLDVQPGDWYIAIDADWTRGDASFVVPVGVERR
jgi:hypothetical protein